MTPELDLERIETKLAAARTRLILDKPFLGALVLRLPMQAARPDWCPTTATDARAFFYNPEYIASLSMEQTQFMLAHEALHCALSHFARRSSRRLQQAAGQGQRSAGGQQAQRPKHDAGAGGGGVGNGSLHDIS